MIAIADLLTKEYDGNVFIHKIGIIAGIVFCFNLTAYLLEKKRIKTYPFLSAASFFVFAIHDPFLLQVLKKLIYRFFNPESDVVITGLYFLIVIVVVLAALGIYYALSRFLPKFTAVITGGRL
jgi:hypothetical protein